MSGGVDSSVAAALLKEQGHEVVGISLQLWNYSRNGDERFGSCCSLDDLADARRVADKIGIPFYILNMEKEFQEEVVDNFVSEYLSGRTPIPCTLCNQRLKFDHLLNRAREFGIEQVATGHYASVVADEDGRRTIQRGRDRGKDQSYFLFGLSQEQLARLHFPLGNTTKPEVRRIAKSLGLNVAEKSESYEICFVPDNNYRNFLAKHTNGKGFDEGSIVDSSGKRLGDHGGYVGFTVGQRKGLNLGGLDEPYFVTHIDPESNEVTVGPRRELERSSMIVQRVNWRLPMESELNDVSVQIRYRHNGAPAAIFPLEDNQARVEFHEPQSAVSPGQAAVFYKNDRILGGGWIV